MTGYGFKRAVIKNEIIEIEIKSLNSKYFDIQNQIPKELNHKEIHIINLLKKNLKRGKVNLSITKDLHHQSTTNYSRAGISFPGLRLTFDAHTFPPQ